LRVRVIFDLRNKGATVPFHHQFLLAQIIRGILVRGGDSCHKDYSLYNFSGLKGQTRVGRSGLHYFSKKVTVVFSSPKKDFVDYFLRNLFELPAVEVGNLELVPDSVDQEIIPKFDSRGKFICISPLVLVPAVFRNEESKLFISPNERAFTERLLDSTRRRLNALEDPILGDISPPEFQFEPDQDYLAKIQIGQKKFSRIYPLYDDDVKYEVRGYTFPFTLGAEPHFFKFLFDCGLGEYTHKGFGMLDVGSTAYQRVIEPYQF